MIDPEAGAAQWDVLRVGDRRSPGVCKVTGDGIVIQFDTQNATAQTGATNRRIGEPIRKFRVTIQLSNEDDGFGVTDFDRWTIFQQYLEEMVANKSKTFARDMYHPTLAEAHITAATVEKIGLVETDGKGLGTVVVDFIEYRPPKPLRPVASTKTEGDKKIDAATAELKALQDEWKTLGSNPTPQSIGATL